MIGRRQGSRATEERINLALWVVGVLIGVMFGVIGTLMIGLTSGVIQ